ncbi:AMP-dependent synthetase/ligase [Haliangium sp.]|uniref:AMP-dependent synthetase/ligase n=1 Tax=Haliangium sp. TaxID=2663208 RepID=UPI003D0AF3E4
MSPPPPDAASSAGSAGSTPSTATPAAAVAGPDRGSDTLPGRLADKARRHPDRVALREKSLGLWAEITWRDYRDRVAEAARMLWELGVRPGDAVAVLSDNRPEWLYADLAAQSIGARAVGIYQTNPPADVAYVIVDSGSKVLFCEDQEQYDKALDIRDQTPTLTHVIVFDPRGTRHVDDPRRMDWDAFRGRGRELLERDDDDDDAHRGGEGDGWYERRVAALDPHAPAMVVYTSGTTGPPKGAMLSSANVLTTTDRFVAEVGLSERDSVLSYLPLCHVAEKIFSVFLSLCAGAVVHFGESIETVQSDLREVSPTVFLGVPRIWEKMASAIQVRMQYASWLKRTLYRLFLARGRAIAERRRDGRVGWLDALLWRVGDLVLYRPLQERLGLRRCWFPISGAAPVAPELLAWFHAVGIEICEGYGMTESAGVSHYNPPGRQRLGTVGCAAPAIEHRVAADGEILIRGPNVFCGYLGRDDATAEAIDEDGWLHTGDIGAVDDDGYLRITGRKKEIIITAGGKNLSPEKIENALKTSPYIKEAVAIGDQRRYVSALIQIDQETVGDWATRQGLPYTSFENLSQKPEVRTLIGQEVDNANRQLVRVEEVRAFRLLHKELHQDDGELTATQKVRRRVVLDKNSDLIDAMYT